MRSRAFPLDEGFSAEVDKVAEGKWYEIIRLFSDANIYQTWSYDATRCGEKNLSHLVLRAQGEIVAAAQARIVRPPVLGLGAAYVRWGPLWQIYGRDNDANVFRQALRALRNEYVGRRGFILRILPVLFSDENGTLASVLLDEGYMRGPEKSPSRTLLLDMCPPLQQIRKNMDQKWRNCLNRAERNGLQIVEGTEDTLFEEFIRLYREMLERKKFEEPNDINEFRTMQLGLPAEFKMRIFLCRSGGANSAGAICSAIGDTGIYLFGATNHEGMRNKGSYLVQWRVIQWLKEMGCRSYNLNGINPTANPGTYHFKAGIAGKNGLDVCYLGRFDCYSRSIAAAIARTADLALPLVKKAKASLRSRNRSGAKNTGPRKR
ncbi:MAG: peptidoglycan bridge formation glycyltransferase FemA/FemB family protein [candidate division WOR-3 bacterium]